MYNKYSTKTILLEYYNIIPKYIKLCKIKFKTQKLIMHTKMLGVGTLEYLFWLMYIA